MGRHPGGVRGEAHGLARDRRDRQGRRRGRAAVRSRRRHDAAAVYTRTGRPFFGDTTELVDRLRAAAAPLFESLDTDWLALDCELLPWSAKAIDLIKSQYASVGAAARHAAPRGAGRPWNRPRRAASTSATLAGRTRQRLANAAAFRAAYAAYCRPTDGLDGITLAPFQILACEGRALALTESHEWHLAELAKLDGDGLITPTRYRFVDLSSAQERAEASTGGSN